MFFAKAIGSRISRQNFLNQKGRRAVKYHYWLVLLIQIMSDKPCRFAPERRP
jgi:hypothetical protein